MSVSKKSVLAAGKPWSPYCMNGHLITLLFDISNYMEAYGRFKALCGA